MEDSGKICNNLAGSTANAHINKQVSSTHPKGAQNPMQSAFIAQVCQPHSTHSAAHDLLHNSENRLDPHMLLMETHVQLKKCYAVCCGASASGLLLAS